MLADGSVWRLRDLASHGVAASTVRRAVAAGTIDMVSRGTYRASDVPRPFGASVAEVVARAPRGIVCLFSAAEIHELGDVSPPSVWLALPNKDRVPQMEYPAFRPVLWRAASLFEVGVEEREICGVRVRVTDPARTVVDMFRMRSIIGSDRALECLRDYTYSGRSLPEVLRIADRLGATKRVAPYVESFRFMRPPP